MSVAAPTSVTSMKAVVVDRPVALSSLKLTEIPVPSIASDQILVRVLATSANPVDVFPTSLAGYLLGGRKPSVVGTDYAGVVEAVGSEVTEFRVGDEVFGGARGAFAEYISVRAGGAVVHKPANVSFESAGAVAVAATTALQGLRDHGGLVSGQRVLINGASGGVGTFAVQIAVGLGATVTAVCSTRNVEMVRGLGAAEVIDYTRADFTRGSEKYDLIADIAGTHSLGACRRVLAPRGTYVAVGVSGVMHKRAGMIRVAGHLLRTRVTSALGSQKVVTLFIADLTKEAMDFLASLLADGRITSVIDRRYAVSEVGAAMEYLNTGHARAKVAVSV